MKLMTPAIASEPYTAEAPSFRISTRSIAANGMIARFTPPHALDLAGEAVHALAVDEHEGVARPAGRAATRSAPRTSSRR